MFNIKNLMFSGNEKFCNSRDFRQRFYRAHRCFYGLHSQKILMFIILNINHINVYFNKHYSALDKNRTCCNKHSKQGLVGVLSFSLTRQLWGFTDRAANNITVYTPLFIFLNHFLMIQYGRQDSNLQCVLCI